MNKKSKRWNCRKVILTDIKNNKRYETETITEALQIAKTSWHTLQKHDGETFNGFNIKIIGKTVRNKTRGIRLMAIENNGIRLEYPSLCSFASSHYMSNITISQYLKGKRGKSVVRDAVRDVWIKGERE